MKNPKSTKESKNLPTNSVTRTSAAQKNSFQKNTQSKKRNIQTEIYGKSGLKERGWTDTMISKYAPNPLYFVDNPKYKHAAPVPIYDLKKIKHIEKTKYFIQFLEKSKKRRESAQKAVHTKYERTLSKIDELIEQLEPPIRLSLGELTAKAEKAFEHHQKELFMIYTWNYEPRDFFPCKRNLCNYIRHNMIKNYDNDCWSSKGMVGNESAYQTYKQSVMELIWSVYPELRYNKDNRDDSESLPKDF